MDGNIDPDSGLFWQFGSSTSLDVFLEQVSLQRSEPTAEAEVEATRAVRPAKWGAITD